MSVARLGIARSELRWRLRLLACSLVLVALAVVQSPGYLVADTKLDLAVDPAQFLLRATHLWDPQGAFGQVQNQAYGYFLPMGPWFLLGSALDLPGWVVQRLWLALVMVVAFLGMVRLAGALGVGGPLSRVVAGFAFALSPRMVSTLGSISIEAWPSAMTPWVLLPLVLGSREGSPRRAAALSAMAVALTGGVNAAATAAVLPLGLLWLLTRPAGPRRRQLLLWWPPLTLLATFWWLVPLLLLGRYSPPFLDFIENSTVTTLPTTLFDSLRGTSAWVPYIEPGWRAGNDLITTSFLILNSGVVLFLGVVGLARRDLPHRRFLVLGLLAGLLVVTAGHLGSVQGWFAEPLQVLLDGPLAPLRNVHKYDVLIRLPMVLGVAHVLEQLRRLAVESRSPGLGWWRRQPAVMYAGVLTLGVVGVLGAAGPAWSGRLTPAGGFLSVPGYWQDAADWLADRNRPTRALLLPGSSFGTYIWGTPRDEPMQVLARSPWAVRDAIPLAPPGTIRMLDAVEARMADGRASKGLAAYLARAGVSHLVVRNDLRRGSDIPDPVLVHQVLRQTPGISRVAVFGPEVGGESRIYNRRRDRVSVNYGWQTTFPAVEIYAVRDPAPAAGTRRPPTVVGGPEDLLDLADAGVLATTPTTLAVDAPAGAVPGALVLTDGLRRRETTFGRVHDSHSYTLSLGEGRREHPPAREYELAPSARWETVAQLVGARSLTASSSMADSTAPGPVRPEWMPWSAFDRDVRTQWVSTPDDETPWVQLGLSRPRTLPFVRVTGGDALGERTQLLHAVTDQGRSQEYEVAPGQTVTVRLPRAETGRVRLEGRPGTRLALAEVLVPGTDLSRPLRMPRPVRGWPPPDVILMSAGDGARSGCVAVETDVRCAPDRDRNPEEPFSLDRLVTVSAEDDYRAEVTAAPIGGPVLEGLIQRDQPLNVSASSAAVSAPMASGLAAVDGSLGTTWVADRPDPRPTLRLNWLGRTRISGIALTVDVDAAATPPTRATVVYPGGRQTVELDRDGHADLEPFRTDHLEVRLAAEERAASVQFDNSAEPLGIGVSEIRMEGLDLLPMRIGVQQERFECGTGPILGTNRKLSQSRLVASPKDLYLGREVPARVCGGGTVSLRSGENRIRLVGSAVAAGRALLLTGENAAESLPAALPADLARKSAVGKTVAPSATRPPSTVVVRENGNPGWVDTSPHAQPAVADGWQQAWRLTGLVDQRLDIRFAPDTAYRVGLVAGVDALLLLVVVALWRPRPRDASLSEASRDVIPPAVMGSAALLGAGLLAGWSGVMVAVAGIVVAAFLARLVDQDTWPWVTGVPVALAALLYAWRPLGSDGGWAGNLALPQYLVLLSLVWLMTAESRRGGFMLRRLMKGRSTTR